MNIELPKKIDLGLPQEAKNNRNQIVVALLLLIICVLFYWFLVMPKNSELTASKASLEQVTQEESQISVSVANLKKMVGQLKSNATQISQLDEAMPLEAKILRFKQTLQWMGDSVGVSVNAIDVTGDSDAAWAGDQKVLANPYAISRTMQKLSGTASVTGPYTQVIAFLKKVENSGRIINVNSVNFDSSTDGNINMQISLVAFYLGPAASAK